MNSTNRLVFEAPKSMQVHGCFLKSACTQDKVIYTLSQLRQGTLEDITKKLKEFEPKVNAFTHQKNAAEVLDYLFEKGLVKLTRQNGKLIYNLVNA